MSSVNKDASLILILRSGLFWIGFSSSTIVIATLALLTFFLPFKYRYWFISLWTYFNLWWLKITCGIRTNIEGEENIDASYTEKHFTSIDTSNYRPIVDGMDLVVNGGDGSTARNAKIQGIRVCGKTGTAENPHGNDHSIFIAFAPKKDPKIAIAVYVENQGFGSTYAAPIASLMIEKYLNREVKRTWYENWVMQLIQPVAPVREKDSLVSDTIPNNLRGDGTEE